VSGSSGVFFFFKGIFFINHKAIDYKIIFSPLTSDNLLCFCQKSPVSSCILLHPLHLILSFRGLGHLGFTPHPPVGRPSLPDKIIFICQPQRGQLCSKCQCVIIKIRSVTIFATVIFLWGLMRFWLCSVSTLRDYWFQMKNLTKSWFQDLVKEIQQVL